MSERVSNIDDSCNSSQANHTTPQPARDCKDDNACCVAFRLTVEKSAVALSRLFGIVSHFHIIPVSVWAQVTVADSIEVSINLSSADLHKGDLLARKLSQLTETIDMHVSIVDPRNPDSGLPVSSDQIEL